MEFEAPKDARMESSESIAPLLGHRRKVGNSVVQGNVILQEQSNETRQTHGLGMIKSEDQTDGAPTLPEDTSNSRRFPTLPHLHMNDPIAACLEYRG